jgi:E3 ubiquitin-protein ligase UBR2
MLFNDEVHTYEQVIYTLQKAVNCTQKEAIGFATTVDRDVSNFIISQNKMYIGIAKVLLDRKFKKIHIYLCST